MQHLTQDNAMSAYKAMELRQDEICWYAHQTQSFTDGLFVMSKGLMRQQMKNWRNSYRKGKINILACNSKSATTPDGKEWHFFVVQPMNLDDAWTDPFALFLLGEMVDGWVYCFSDKRNRDRIQEYVLKKS